MKINNNFAIIVGARPNFVKLAPFIKRAKNYPKFKFKIIHTGQHFDANMSDVFFNDMEIPRPDISLEINGRFCTERMAKMFNSLKNIFNENNFDAVIVFGDVNSTLAGAIAGVKNNCKIIHIESGLRSHDKTMPEEINRIIVDHLSDILFTTESAANYNLLSEGIEEEKINYVGNIMIESIELFRDKFMRSNILDDLNLEEKKYIVTTIHKQANIDNPKRFEKILKIINQINKYYKVVFPLHPGTKEKIYEYGMGNYLKNIKVIEPLGYLDFKKLLINSKGVMGDSCGIQDETSYLGIPCCTLNSNTERPITLDVGSNKLFNINNLTINDLITHLDNNFKSKHIEYWDDKVSERIFNILDNNF